MMNRNLRNNHYCRDNEINFIKNYILINLELPSPPLLITGDPGTGKSSLCHCVLKELCIKHVSLRCSKYNNEKNILQFLWIEILNIIEDINIPVSLSEYDVKIINYESFLSHITELMQVLKQHINVVINANILFIDDIDKIMIVDLPLELIRLAEILFPVFKLIITSTTLHFSTKLVISLHLKPYSDVDIQSIVQSKYCDCKNYFIESINSLNINVNNNLNLLQDSYEKLYKESLEYFMIITRDVGIIWKYVIDLWNDYLEEIKAFSTIDQFSLLQITRNLINKIKNSKYLYCSTITYNNRSDCINKDFIYQNISLTVKFLLISIFLASVNPASSDLNTFGGHRQSKRHKNSLIDDNIIDHDIKSNNNGYNIFKLDRILGIFTQLISNEISTISENSRYNDILQRKNFNEIREILKTINNKHGNDFLFSQINYFEKQSVLYRARGWSINSLLYYSSLSKNDVVTIAKSIPFNIDPYIHL